MDPKPWQSLRGPQTLAGLSHRWALPRVPIPATYLSGLTDRLVGWLIHSFIH